jgi:hypothetical protein
MPELEANSTDEDLPHLLDDSTNYSTSDDTDLEDSEFMDSRHMDA